MSNIIKPEDNLPVKTDEVTDEFAQRGFNFVDEAINIYNTADSCLNSGEIEPKDALRLKLDVLKAFLPYRYTSKKPVSQEIQGDMHQTVNVVQYQDSALGHRALDNG